MTAVLGLSFMVSAQTPYASYTETEWNTSVPAPDAFVPEDRVYGRDFGVADFRSPTDLTFDSQGNLYVLESSGRIVVLDADFQLVRVMDDIKDAQGQSSPLRDPRGIFVDDDGSIYVADAGNSRAVRLNQEGVIQTVFTKPDDAAYTAEIYQPMKILCDNTGMVYILSEGVYQGLLQYTPEGEFTSFFGSAKIQLTPQLIIDRLWKSLLSQDARNNMRQYVPISFTSMDIDEKGFVYTCSYYTTNDVEQVRKLNHLGSNVFPYTDNFGEEDTVHYKNTDYTTNFTDICISSDQVLYVLDATRGRVYAFDQEGNRLFTFGTLGEMVGAFSQVTALDTYGGDVYVLDGQDNSITRFRPTEYGKQILEAVALYNDGQYEAALEPWRAVLRMNANYEIAYSGIGEAMMKMGNYEEAVRYFRLGYDRERESKAFAQYRSAVMRDNIGFVLVGLLALVVLLLVVTNKRFRRWRASKRKERSNLKGLSLSFQFWKNLVRRPLETYNEMKYRRYTSFPFTVIVIGAFFVTEALARQYYGFRFNLNNPDTFNIFVQFSSTVVLFLLFGLTNWGVCAIADGKGRLGEIYTAYAYALTPYILFRLISIPMSMIMTLEESVFLNGFVLIGLLWTVYLLFQAVRLIHQFTTGKTILMILLTIVGIAIVLFVFLLILALFQQVFAFISGIYRELRYRA